MSELDVVPKRGVNKFHGYKYLEMGDLLRQVTPLLGKHGLVSWQTETGRAMFDGDNVLAIEYAFTVAHVSGETSEPMKRTGMSRCRDSKGGYDDKALNKCATAARKYFLLSMLQIPTGDEEDADRGDLDAPRSREKLEQRDEEKSQRATFPSDAEISARRAAVRLSRALHRPRYEAEPPKRRLDRFIQAQRDTSANYEARIKAEQRGERVGKFRQEIEPRRDERNPPSDLHDDIPDFLDRR